MPAIEKAAHTPPYSGALTRSQLLALRPLAGVSRYQSWTISDLKRDLGVTGRALRFYEEVGLISPARRRGQRAYGPKDHARLQLILRGRAVGLTVETIREILEAYETLGADAQAELALGVFRQQLLRLAERRRKVTSGIDELKTAIGELESKAAE